MKLAVLTCLARMLEIKSAELEGDEGSGPLERDQKILEAAKDPEGQPSPVIQEAACMLLPYRTCMGQKTLVYQSNYSEWGFMLFITVPQALRWCSGMQGRAHYLQDCTARFCTGWGRRSWPGSIYSWHGLPSWQRWSACKHSLPKKMQLSDE